VHPGEGRTPVYPASRKRRKAREVCNAEEAMDEADAERASSDPDYEEVANQCGKVIDKTLDAIDDCS
jgi:hypothetical protein